MFLAVILAVCVTIFLPSFNSSNQVEIVNTDLPIEKYSRQKGDTEDATRYFINLFPDVEEYPISCEGDCYPPTDDIKCSENMHDCQYIGAQPTIKDVAGFDLHWLGHASFRVQTDNGQVFLFDPVFGQFDWPVNWGFRVTQGFNRQPADAVEFETLEKVDAVMYSHNHYDHFNRADIEKINNEAQFLLPLGLAKRFPGGDYQVSEMGWYSQKKIGDVTAHFVPAHHFSSRTLLDQNQSLWGGWVLEHAGKRLFFAGDTGYSPHFNDIAERYGEIDVCLLPIASYFSESRPEWYRKVHTTPEDALVAAQDLNCKIMIPWGYGNASWRMGDHTSHSALFRLLHMQKKMNAQTSIYVMNEGEKQLF
ncbi:Zn-dependent hydrolase [Veronia nyctiphanis]|uniref:Zn-dependent hydrolase n=2 Tax=Veronia nyctiphanis TaxID=1278244 RepID=A0A4Q0YTF2_9GAMM|nr:Zn-dependent hydrolase [Veronia nyctiphanis]